MKYSLAIVALLGVASAIKIREEPAAAPEDAKAKEAKENEKAAAAAGAPPANTPDPSNPGKAPVKEALKTEEEKSDEAAAAAG